MPTNNPAPQQLVRQNGQLVQTTLQASQVPTPAPQGSLPPATPVGAKALGATPDAAKMVGTPAQKTNALVQATKPSTSLAEQSRLTPAPAPQTAPDKAAIEKADRLRQLGSLGTRVQGLIEQRLTAATQAQPVVAAQVSDDALKAMFGTDVAKAAAAKTALQAYLTGGQTQEQLNAVATALGQDAIANGGLANFIQGAGATLAGVGNQVTGTPAKATTTLGELGWTDTGVDPDQLAQDLGVTRTALDAMSPDQLQQSVQNQLNTQYSNVDQLRAEYAGASPNRRKQIITQLSQLDATGQAAAEASVGDLGRQMDANENVKFAGKEYRLQDLLKSDAVSSTIRAAAGDPKQLAELAKTEPGLAHWIETNQHALEAVAAHANEQVGAFTQTQADMKAVGADLSDPLREKFLGELPANATPEDVAAKQAELDANPVYQAIQADPELATTFSAHPEFVEAVSGPASGALDLLKSDPTFQAYVNEHPEALTALDGQTTEQVGLAFDAYNTLATTAGPAVRQILGLGDGDVGLTLNPAQAQQAMELAHAWDSLPPALKDGNPEFDTLMQGGFIKSATDLEHIKDNPALLGELAQVASTQKQAQSWLASPNRNDRHTGLLEMLFGPGKGQSGMTDLLNQVAQAKKVLAYNDTLAPMSKPHQDKATAFLKSVRQFDLNKDGQVDEADFKSNDTLNSFISGPNSVQDLLAAGKSPGQTPYENAQQFLSDPKLGEADRWGAVGHEATLTKAKADKNAAHKSEVQAAATAKAAAKATKDVLSKPIKINADSVAASVKAEKESDRLEHGGWFGKTTAESEAKEAGRQGYQNQLAADKAAKEAATAKQAKDLEPKIQGYVAAGKAKGVTRDKAGNWLWAGQPITAFDLAQRLGIKV